MFISSDEDGEEGAPDGKRARYSNLWLAPVHASVEPNLVWTGYLNSISRGQPMYKEGIDKIECEVNDFHFERMKSPQNVLSPILGPSVYQIPYQGTSCQEILLHPHSSATLEHSFSKLGHIVRARQAT